MISILPIGTSRDIGDSAYLIQADGTSVLLDAGVHPRREGLESLPNYDLIKNVDIEAIMVSHCHLDHLGSLPVALRYFPHARVMMTNASAALAPVLLDHSVRVMERIRDEEGIADYPLYSRTDVEALTYIFQGLQTDRSFPIYSELTKGADFQARFYDAGHILGAAGIYFETPSGSIFYTGDTTAHEQDIVPKAEYPESEVDVLITECTMGADETAEYRTRRNEKVRLAGEITTVINQGGSVLIPAFSLGRTQEMLAMIHAMRDRGTVPDVEIYTAGFGEVLSRVYDRTAYSTRRMDPDMHLRDLDIRTLPRDCSKGPHLKRPSIIVVSSGMMAEHTMSFRMAEKMLPYDHHGIFFVGYIDPALPGHRVINARKGQILRMTDVGRAIPVACKIERFHFSAHSNRQQLMSLIEKLKPRWTLLVHGELEATQWFEQEIKRRKIRTEVLIPEEEKNILLKTQED
ncbi:MAG: MBL fold metallo-hydrolase [Candidatus Latescibacterota bacterium]|nr:MBL fold metallo-hydrolase [Candidatus Latescibacterota bacterium]